MAVLDGAIANVALPTIAGELQVLPANALWIVNAYQLAIIVALLPLAALGDTLGYRSVYIGGMIVFVIGSLACAMSQDLAQLVLARAAQGLGTAAMFSNNAAIVRFTYPERMLGRAIGFNAVVIAGCSALGPTFSAAILSIATWQWLFAVNLPIGIAAIAIALRTLPVVADQRRPFDLLAAVLNALAVGGLIVGVVGLAGAGGALAALALAGGVTAAIFMIRRETGRPHPMFPTDLLKIAKLRLSLATMVVAFAAYMLAFAALPFHLQDRLAHSAVQTGLLMTPWPVAAAVAALFAGRLADRFPGGMLCATSLFVFAIGLATLAMLPVDAGGFDIAWRMALCGIGFGFFQSPNNRAIISAAPRQRSGAAGGLLATGRHLGQASGAGIVALLFHSGIAAPTTLALEIAAVAACFAGLIGIVQARTRAKTDLFSPGADRELEPRF